MINRHIKVLVSGVLCICTLFSFIVALSADEASVYIDNNKLVFDVPPTIVEGRTLVPLRAIFESLGIKVSWDSDTKTVMGKGNDKIIILQVDNKTAKVNDKDVNLDVPASIINGRTLVPVRFIAESTGYAVNWEAETRSVKIYKQSSQTTQQSSPELLGGLLQDGGFRQDIGTGPWHIGYGHIYKPELTSLENGDRSVKIDVSKMPKLMPAEQYFVRIEQSNVKVNNSANLKIKLKYKATDVVNTVLRLSFWGMDENAQNGSGFDFGEKIINTNGTKGFETIEFKVSKSKISQTTKIATVFFDVYGLMDSVKNNVGKGILEITGVELTTY